MKRYYVGDDGLVQHERGGWISYDDHLAELAKAQAEAGTTVFECKDCGAKIVTLTPHVGGGGGGPEGKR